MTESKKDELKNVTEDLKHTLCLTDELSQAIQNGDNSKSLNLVKRLAFNLSDISLDVFDYRAKEKGFWEEEKIEKPDKSESVQLSEIADTVLDSKTGIDKAMDIIKDGYIPNSLITLQNISDDLLDAGKELNMYNAK